MSRRSGALTRQAANDVFDALVQYASASESQREEFVALQTCEWVSEFRFGGILGFGGKFWRNYGPRPDGTSGEIWYVSAYPEDLRRGAWRSAERQAAIAALASVLDSLRSLHEAATEHGDVPESPPGHALQG